MKSLSYVDLSAIIYNTIQCTDREWMATAKPHSSACMINYKIISYHTSHIKGSVEGFKICTQGIYEVKGTKGT